MKTDMRSYPKTTHTAFVSGPPYRIEVPRKDRLTVRTWIAILDKSGMAAAKSLTSLASRRGFEPLLVP